MKNKIMKFIDETFGNVRGIYLEGQAWVYATDVCKALGIKNTPQAVSSLDDDERMTITSTYSQTSATGKRGGARMYNLINEAGLFRLVFVSRKPNARDFQKWVFHEVLPSIRRTGEYRLAWESAREDGKITRRNFTDTIKKFCEYLERRGELDRPLGTWIIIFSKHINKILDINDERNDLLAKQLFEIDTCENICIKAIVTGMDAGKGHHDIWETCKEKLSIWSELTK